MSAAPGRPKQANAPSGLSPAALGLLAQGGTGQRANAFGVGPYSDDTQCRAWGCI
jgi:hypothetical protein